MNYLNGGTRKDTNPCAGATQHLRTNETKHFVAFDHNAVKRPTTASDVRSS